MKLFFGVVLYLLAIIWFLLVEAFFVYSSFRHGFWDGMRLFFLSQVNPLTLMYHIPTALFIWFAIRLTKEKELTQKAAHAQVLKREA